ncbi:MAG: ABC transporter permease, partial [Lentisphaeraceae bacterium]|nr:ABC transporter permease [Lentisphaeraceae bacterium]
MIKLFIKSLLFYKRRYLWTFAGLVLAAAILNGALSVGSSVKQSLHDMAAKRLGGIEFLVDARLNPVSQRLSDELGEKLETTSVLMMLGSANFNDKQVNNVFVNGIDQRFSSFFPDAPDNIDESTAWLSHNLATKLGVKEGDGFVLRVRNHSLLPGDLPLTGSSDEYIALRLSVKILPETSNTGRFSLMAAQVPPLNVFLNLSKLQNDTNMAGLVNEIFVKNSDAETVEKYLNEMWLPQDSSMTLRKADNDTVFELISNRVFLPEGIVEESSASKVLTYMANEISFGKKATPYSIVSGIDFETKNGAIYQGLPELSEDEVLLNQWTADDLGAKAGDKISIKYFVDNEDGKLREDTADFIVKGVVAPEKLDRLLMPSYPGIADEEHCRDWEPGIPMDMQKIRDKDEDYWDEYKGTPKLIINYKSARKYWGNRFGQTTSLRWPISKGESAVLKDISQNGVKNSGLSVIDIQKEAGAAASQGIDFGMLFVSMSFFIIISALLLSGLLLAFQLEERRSEMGIMASLGFTSKEIRRRFVGEGLLLSILALVPGIPLGLIYTKLVIDLLSTVWYDAIGTTEIFMHVNPMILSVGSLTFIVFALVTVFWVVKKFVNTPISEQLSGSKQEQISGKANLKLFYLGWFLLLVSVVLVVVGSDNLFAAASGTLLLSALFLSHGFLQKMRYGKSNGKTTLGLLSVRNISRQINRSLGAIILMACGSYLVLNTASRQKSFNLDKSDKAAGTGGYEYFAKTSVPLRYKPDSPEGLTEYVLDIDELGKTQIVSMRVHQGDDASCLNLNRAQNPQVFGISSKEFKGRFNLQDEWPILDKELEDGSIPVIGDENTVLWGLGLYAGVGSKYEIRDEQGRLQKVTIVGLLKNSTLQGALIMNRKNFDKLYPAESGYSLFLIDVPSEDYDLEENFTSSFSDFGLELEDS